jgi:DNA-binding MarR family transcriptional regulator
MEMTSDSLFRPGRRARVLQLLRHYTDNHVELSRQLARLLGVHPTDAVAVTEILWAETAEKSLSPAGLSERIGLTSGATANLLNRLEAAGLIVRSREGTDRRIVTLHLTPEARAKTTEFFLPTGEQLDQVLAGYDDAALERVERLLTDVVTTIATRNAHLRDTPSAAVAAHR